MEDNKETVENVNVEETGKEVTQTLENEVKTETFTQEQVNSMLKKEKEKVMNKYKDIDIAKYKEWEESQKTAEQKQAEKEAEYQKVMSENLALKQEKAILSAGVSNEDSDYVLFKVSKMEGEFEENLAKFLKDNPKFLGQERKEQVATGTPVRSISSNKDGVLSILASKHPEINF